MATKGGGYVIVYITSNSGQSLSDGKDQSLLGNSVIEYHNNLHKINE